MAGFEFPNDTARIAVFATLGGIIFLVVVFIVTVILRLCFCSSKSKKKSGTLTKHSTGMNGINLSGTISQFHLEDENQKEKSKTFQNGSYVPDNAYDEIHQGPLYAEADDVVRANENHVTNSPPKKHVVFQTDPLSQSNNSQDFMSMNVETTTDHSQNHTGNGYISQNDFSEKLSSNGSLHSAITDSASNTAQAKVKKAKKGGKKYVKPKKYKGNKDKGIEGKNEQEATPTLGSMIPEEDRMY